MSNETKPTSTPPQAADDRLPEINPAGGPPTDETPKVPERPVRIPMSVPRRKLATPPIPGYHQYWFLEVEVPAALQAAYEFVTAEEVQLNRPEVANDPAASGNIDLGGHVRVLAGTSDSVNGESLVLMKLRLEWYREDCKVLEQHNAKILAGIFRNEQIMGSEKTAEEDRALRYVKTALLQRPARKG